tara:strand:- start:554 stop:736 length:183 start_codon:yes stop_codon:yes gene_type:complete
MNAQNLIKYQTAERNTAILKRIEKDVSTLQVEINTLKEDIRFIKEYIIAKKEREDKKWFL